MYLKTLEINGFKSFADKTVMQFEPGMTAIVGPNGCGKSNVSDSIRWVLGEQSAKALRGSKMEDVIFTGTDFRKPLGMAEVSITFSDCENVMGTEYNEITITRRVFRTGEGQYFINKTPCRLKDIQRMFMDTGVGTDSYSLLEQGRIDRILSSRPEDRREIFEEASGITKYKADRKEALRKLEQTDANLLRLADVIREVKRQIGSLQRQAGKARRYKELHSELRSRELFLTRERLTSTDAELTRLASDIASLAQKIEAGQAEVNQQEQDSSGLRETLVRTEREIGSFHEAASQGRSRLEHTSQIIEMYRQRIAEYRAISDRSSREKEKASALLEDRRRTFAELRSNMERVIVEKQKADDDLKEINARFEEHRQQVDSARGCLQKLREESVEVEGISTRLHNELMEHEGREKASFLQRERLIAEKNHLMRQVTGYGEKQEEMRRDVELLKTDLAGVEASMAQKFQARAAAVTEEQKIREEISSLQAGISALDARMDMLGDSETAAGELPGGVRAILEDPAAIGTTQQSVLGLLASHIDVDADCRTAAEAVLRPWFDAVIITDQASAMQIIARIAEARKGSARILTAPSQELSDISSDAPGSPLISHIHCSDAALPIIRSLLARTLLVDSLTDVPSPVPVGLQFVTRDGQVVSGNGSMEFWMTEPQSSNPVTRKHLMAAARSEADILANRKKDLESHWSALKDQITALDQDIAGIRAELEKRQRSVALKEGETGVLTKESTDAKSKQETVEWELQNLESRNQGSITRKQELTEQLANAQRRRETLSTDIGRQNSELRALENRYSELNSTVTEKRISASSLAQKMETLETQCSTIETRVQELEAGIKGHIDGITSADAMCSNFEGEIVKAESQIGDLKKQVEENSARVESLGKNREKQAQELAAMEKDLHERRINLEDLRSRRSSQEVIVAEGRVKRQNMLERVSSEYSVTLEDVMSAPEPMWEGDRPSLEAIDTMVAEFRTKIEAMGPVNLVAIEEYKELEERDTFLNNQKQDLDKSKEQLMEFIRKINRETTEMFRSTFEQVNINFDAMFRKLFNGGTAKLVLVNEEDLLECGIEIIARPPGKRLQNVSLLSGGERTMTAVGLLFAIYMIKPSPFCLLDELDAALDEANIGRFVTMLKDFLTQSQFVVITHNRQTIAAAEIMYGVTMPEKGISKIVSMKFKEYKETGPVSAQSQPVLN